jgi:hypothetical protein
VSINTVPYAGVSAALGEYLQQYRNDTGALIFHRRWLAISYSAASDVPGKVCCST